MSGPLRPVSIAQTAAMTTLLVDSQGHAENTQSDRMLSTYIWYSSE